MGSRGRSMSRICDAICRISAIAFTPGAAGHGRFGASTSPRQMVASVRSAYQHWRTRSSKVRSRDAERHLRSDFLGFSYGFRPGRSPHQALSSLRTAIMSRNVNWVLDADIRSSFDSVDHEWLVRMLAHRVADPRVIRLIRMWLRHPRER